jgi:hypothetical protein
LEDVTKGLRRTEKIVRRWKPLPKSSDGRIRLFAVGSRYQRAEADGEDCSCHSHCYVLLRASANPVWSLLHVTIRSVSTVRGCARQTLPWGRVSRSANHNVYRRLSEQCPAAGIIVPLCLPRTAYAISHFPSSTRSGQAPLSAFASEAHHAIVSVGAFVFSVSPPECRPLVHRVVGLGLGQFQVN